VRIKRLLVLAFVIFTSPTFGQTSSPSPTASISPSLSPDQYVDLMQEDDAKLAPDQKKIVEALNHGALELTRVPADEMTAIQNLNSSVFDPLKKMSTLKDVASLKAGGQSLVDAAAKTNSGYDQERAELEQDLVRAGLTEPLAGQVSEKFIERAKARSAARTEAVAKLGQTTKDLADFLEQTKSKWKRQNQAFAFTSKTASSEFTTRQQKLQAAVQDLNEHLNP
jgi:hypothetical protein